VSEVKVAFLLWDLRINNSVNHRLSPRLNQPDETKCSVFNQCVIVCTVPPQDWDVIQEIEKEGLELRICAYRPTDNRMSVNNFKFDYLPHGPSNGALNTNGGGKLPGPAGKCKPPSVGLSKIIVIDNR
jgi:hypothetical protein